MAFLLFAGSCFMIQDVVTEHSLSKVVVLLGVLVLLFFVRFLKI